nr:SH3 domain-containing protein [Clostridium niameyense]
MKSSKKTALTCVLSTALVAQHSIAVFAYNTSMNPNLSSNAYNSSNIFTKCGYKGQCTWFTYGRTLEKLGVSLPSQFYGNAIDWWNCNIKSNVYSYGQEPRDNSIVVWSGGSKGFGHVGFIEKVSGDTVYFNEGNASIRGDYDGYVKKLSKEQMKHRGNLYLKGYIYVGSGTSSSGNNTNNNSSSNNNYNIIATSKVKLSSNSSSLNVRSAPSLSSSVIGSLSNNTTVSIINQNNGWSKIKYGNNIGYISSKYLNNNNSSNSDNNNYNIIATSKVKLSSNSSSLNVRSAPSLSSSIIGSLSNNSTVSIINQNNGWSKIKYGNSIGYINSRYLNNNNSNNNNSSGNSNNVITKNGHVVLSNKSSLLNVRSSTNTSSKIMGSLKHGSSVNIISQVGSWYKIKYGSSIAYVNSNYISLDNNCTTNSNTNSNSNKNNISSKGTGTVKLSNSNSKLNIRISPNTSSKIIGSLNNGDSVNITGKSGQWYQIKYGSSTAYVSADYISNKSVTTNSYGVVSLSNKYSSLNVRSNPSLSSTVISSLAYGNKVKILDTVGSWYKININNITGYVYSTYIK